MHIVTDTLGNGFTLQLRKNRCNIHHGSSHRGAGVKLLLDGNKRNIQTGKFFNQSREVADITADTVKTIDNDCLKLSLFCCIHHSFECRTVQIPSGKSLIFIYYDFIYSGITKMHTNILFAKFNLIANTLAFPCKF